MDAGQGEKRTHEELMTAIGAADSQAAASAATVLGLRGDERAIGALVELLHHASPDARSAAATALGLIGSETVIPALREATSDPESTVAAAASVALQRLGDEDSADAACGNLVTELCAADAERRALAARALGGLMRPAAVEPLLRALRDVSAQVRADAAGSLGWLGDARATTLLTSVGFTDPDPFVREVAIHAVARLVTPASFPGTTLT